MRLQVFCLVFLFLMGCETKDNLDSLSSSSVVDRDKLVEQFLLIHDFNSGEEFDTHKLKEIQNDSDRQDYKKVLNDFFTQHLEKEMESFQTIHKSEHERHILVTTKDQWLFRVSLKQWADYHNIWTVDMYGGFPQSQ
ncbi:hypothetical protein EDM57_15570 [Brevibacillus gelatini]|uniref:Lipoprotein n=1 Tax=Brevibacillus gelatini TaxID=1655277 RepID=A0A3M8AV56_9BACL|nr:hypothetical protein [Brevibacillus gelatini]RNB55052.1 hypothetical protein EDM57_15570 [Brevibacillus gelatini]